MGLSSGACAALGVLACVYGGVCNSTWPLFTNVKSPKLIRIVSPNGWGWNHAWLAFTVVHVSINALYICCMLGTDTLHQVYSQSPASDVALVCAFSFLWGLGTMLFVVAIAMLGAGLGACLFMSLLVVIGTVLPLVRDYAGQAASVAALMTIGGLALAIVGFGLSAYSSKLRQEGTVHASRAAAARRLEAIASHRADADATTASDASNASDDGGVANRLELGKKSAAKATDALAAFADAQETELRSAAAAAAKDAAQAASAAFAGGENGGQEPIAPACGECSGEFESVVNKPEGAASGDSKPASAAGAGGFKLAKDLRDDDDAAAAKEVEAELAAEVAAARARFWLGVVVCVAGACSASMLQFAFVFGDKLIKEAETIDGISRFEAPLVIWLLAFTLAGSMNIGYAVVLITRERTWRAFLLGGMKANVRRLAQVTLMSVLFLSHIHLYGTAQALFKGLGPVVAWPLLMSSTVLSGQIWGIALKEWVGAPAAAVRANAASISVLIVAVTVIAVAGAVL